jgi:hypothetical protein
MLFAVAAIVAGLGTELGPIALHAAFALGAALP